MKTTYEESFASVETDDSIGLVKVTWLGFANQEQYKKVLLHALDQVEKESAKLWLSDMTKAKAVPPASTAWSKSYVIPKGAELGIRKVAFILSADAFHQIYEKQVSTAIQALETLQLKYFDNEVEAIEWLKEA